jgi:hypothetical protein
MSHKIVTISVEVRVADMDDANMITESLREFAQDAMDWCKIDPQPKAEITAVTDVEE